MGDWFLKNFGWIFCGMLILGMLLIATLNGVGSCN